MWIPRTLEKQISKSLTEKPAILITGMRQSGKSSLIQHMFPEAKYVTLDSTVDAQFAEENPQKFLQQFQDCSKVLLDEIQYAPSLFRHLKMVIDNNRDVYGKWILTGSQKFPLMKGASESLAGRIAIHELYPLSASELRIARRELLMEQILIRSGYPELWNHPEFDSQRFLNDYVTTWFQKDLRQLANIAHMRDFNRFLRICAAQASGLLNMAHIAKDTGVSPNTVKGWISILEASGVIVLLEPWFANLSKRLVKTPKLYFTDTGLLASLIGIHNMEALKNHICAGALWENFVFTELIKTTDVYPGKNLFFYRDQNGVEIDFILEEGGQLTLIEAKFAEQPSSPLSNISKVRKLIEVKEAIVACRVPGGNRISLREYTMLNPLDVEITRSGG